METLHVFITRTPHELGFIHGYKDQAVMKSSGVTSQVQQVRHSDEEEPPDWISPRVSVRETQPLGAN